MLEKKHNEYSKQFMQKILMFIDTVLINASSSEKEDANKVLVGGLLNVRDAIFSEVVRDNQVVQFNQFLQQKEAKKKRRRPKKFKSRNRIGERPISIKEVRKKCL